ncbi:MAG: HEAT repeat domain-containing protein, partial [Planctomycetes bacterium]|nr:HEAT repeat domain-containing protein [Planctomycetota bacterium]
TSTEENRDDVRAELLEVLIGTESKPASGDPHLRATAAQGLGNLGSSEDAPVLLDSLMGPLQDRNVQVRIESAISLGKLDYTQSRDLRRDVINRLRDRLVFERNDSGRLMETAFLVRTSMLNSLIGIGGRSAASAIHDVAGQVYKDIENPRTNKFTSSTDRGLLDRCLEGMILTTKVDRQKAVDHRNNSNDLTPHLDWWTHRISEMDED